MDGDSIMEPTWKEYRIFAAIGSVILVALSFWLVPHPITWWRVVMPVVMFCGLLAIVWYDIRKRR